MGAAVYPSITDMYNAWDYMDKLSFPQDGIVKVKVEFMEHIPAADCWAARNKEDS